MDIYPLKKKNVHFKHRNASLLSQATEPYWHHRYWDSALTANGLDFAHLGQSFTGFGPRRECSEAPGSPACVVSTTNTSSKSHQSLCKKSRVPGINSRRKVCNVDACAGWCLTKSHTVCDLDFTGRYWKWFKNIPRSHWNMQPHRPVCVKLSSGVLGQLRLWRWSWSEHRRRSRAKAPKVLTLNCPVLLQDLLVEIHLADLLVPPHPVKAVAVEAVLLACAC